MDNREQPLREHFAQPESEDHVNKAWSPVPAMHQQLEIHKSNEMSSTAGVAEGEPKKGKRFSDKKVTLPKEPKKPKAKGGRRKKNTEVLEAPKNVAMDNIKTGTRHSLS